MAIEIRKIAGVAGLTVTASLRRLVFIDEQQVPEELEWDRDDDEALHYVASFEGRTLAVARVLQDPDATVKVQRVAVRQTERQRGIGRKLMDEIVRDARRSGATRVVLDAQLRAV